MREEFEKLPEIAQLIEEGKGDNLIFISETNKYDAEMYITFTPDYVHYLNGAWYAFQEQQKKIDQLVGVISTGLRIEQSMSDQIHSLKEKIDTAIEYLDSIEGLVWYEQIKELLK